MRKVLAAVAAFTLMACCWLTVMTLVLQHPVFQAVVFCLFVVQNALTLGALFPDATVTTVRRIRPVVLAGAVGVLYGGGAMVAAQARASHFEGYAMVIGFALAVQGILTLCTFLPVRTSART